MEACHLAVVLVAVGVIAIFGFGTGLMIQDADMQNKRDAEAAKHDNPYPKNSLRFNTGNPFSRRR